MLRYCLSIINNYNNIFVHIHFRANQIIRDKSDATAVTFMYLAPPPRTSSPNFAEVSTQYLELLTELTSELPPVVMVHGINAVTSTNL